MYGILAKQGNNDLGYLYFDRGIRYTTDRNMAVHYGSEASAKVMLGLVESADCLGVDYSVVHW